MAGAARLYSRGQNTTVALAQQRCYVVHTIPVEYLHSTDKIISLMAKKKLVEENGTMERNFVQSKARAPMTRVLPYYAKSRSSVAFGDSKQTSANYHMSLVYYIN